MYINHIWQETSPAFTHVCQSQNLQPTFGSSWPITEHFYNIIHFISQLWHDNHGSLELSVKLWCMNRHKCTHKLMLLFDQDKAARVRKEKNYKIGEKCWMFSVFLYVAASNLNTMSMNNTTNSTSSCVSSHQRIYSIRWQEAFCPECFCQEPMNQFCFACKCCFFYSQSACSLRLSFE